MAEAGDVQKEINQGMDWTHRVYMGLKSEEDKVCHLEITKKHCVNFMNSVVLSHEPRKNIIIIIIINWIQDLCFTAD